MTPRPSGLHLLAALRHSVATQLQQINAASVAPRLAGVRQALLTLELNNKLEEHLLFPALLEAHGGLGIDTDQRALQTLRDLAARVDPAQETLGTAQRTTLAALEGLTMLHFAAVENLLDCCGDDLDHAALTHGVQGLVQRWQDELRTTGDIEDEEADPVGLPPR